MPIELPHNGTVRGSGTCWRMNSSVAAPASASDAGRRADQVEQPRPGVHVDHERIHLHQHVVGLMDHDVGPFGDDVELVVGHQRGDLDDHVGGVVEPRHLEVHPHQHRRPMLAGATMRAGEMGVRPTFAELLAMPGVVEESELRGSVRVHGVPRRRAGGDDRRDRPRGRRALRRARTTASLQPESLQIHLPSIRVTPDQSPALAAFLAHVDVVVTVHGFGRRPMITSLLLGGRNRRLAAHLAGHLRHGAAGLRDRRRARPDPDRAAGHPRPQPGQPAAPRRRPARAPTARARVEPAVVGLGRRRSRRTRAP